MPGFSKPFLFFIYFLDNTSHKFWDQFPHDQCCLQVSETVSPHKLRCCYSFKINWKVISGFNWLFQNFESVNNLIFIICLYELCSKLIWESSGRKMLAASNSNAVKTTLTQLLRYFKITLPLLRVLQKSLPTPLSLCHLQ